MRAMRGFALLFAVVLLFAASGCGDPVSAAKKVRPAVVLVEVLDKQGTVRSTGSGFFVSSDGLLVTNAHVVQGGAKFRVRREDGSGLDVEGLVHFANDVDLAVLKVICSGVPFLNPVQGKAAEVGERIVVIGSPLGLSGTVTDGIVSAQRSLEHDRLIQITAAISPGSSGSPVTDLRGNLVGVATLGSYGKAQALNFAVPADEVLRVCRLVQKNGAVVIQPSANQRKSVEELAKPSPLGVQDVLVRLQGGFSSSDVLAEVQEKGSAGRPTPGEAARLREAGAKDDLLAALAGAQPARISPALQPGGGGGAKMDENEARFRLRWNAFRADAETVLTTQLERARRGNYARDGARASQQQARERAKFSKSGPGTFDPAPPPAMDQGQQTALTASAEKHAAQIRATIAEITQMFAPNAPARDSTMLERQLESKLQDITSRLREFERICEQLAR